MGSKVSQPVKLPRPVPPSSTEDYNPRASLSVYSKENPNYVKTKQKYRWKPKKKPAEIKTDQSTAEKQMELSRVSNTDQSVILESPRDELDLSGTISDDTITEISEVGNETTRSELIPSSLSTATLKGRMKLNSGPKPQFNGFIQNQEKEAFIRQLEIERQVKEKELHQRQEERILQRLRQQILKKRKEEEMRRKEEEEKLNQLALEIEEQKEQTDEETSRRVAHARQSAEERAGSEKPSKLRQPSVKGGGKKRSQSQTGSEKGRKSKADSPRKTPRTATEKESTDGTKSTDLSETNLEFNKTNVIKTGWGKNEKLVEDYVEDPEPKPPSFTKKDLIPDPSVFKVFDQHAIQAKPGGIRASVSQLVDYLKKPVENHLQMIRVFFRWITYNISFDAEGYFDISKRQPTDPAGVLNCGVTVSEGYSNLFEAMCRYVGIPVKVIHGITKGYEYQVGDNLSIYQNHTQHAWNAVYVIDNWFFVDCAWGAGHLNEDRKFVRKYQEFYFLTDPEKMIVDHFPFMDRNIRDSAKWQLLQFPITINRFSERLKLEIPALEWGVKPVSEKQEHIITVKRKTEIHLRECGDILDDYQVYFSTKTDDQNLVQNFFAYKLDVRDFKVIIHPPKEVDYILKIYGRRSSDRHGEPQLLIQYILKVLEIQPYFRPYPTNFRVFGAIADYDAYGFLRDICREVIFKTTQGEVVIPLRTHRTVQVMTKLEHVENKANLLNYCLVNAKEEGIVIKVRCPYDGYYKFTLFAKKSEGGSFRPVATYLIDCDEATHVHSPFPDAFEPTLKLKCSLYKPLWKDLPAHSQIRIIIISPILANVKVKANTLKKDGDTFEGTVTTPGAGQPFTVYGTMTEHGVLFGLYHFNIF